MSCEQFHTTINQIDYSYTQLPATQSLKLKFKLAGILGNAIGEITAGLGKKDAEQMKVFTSAIEHIFSNNDPDMIVELIKKILAPAFRDKKRIDFDADFTGNTQEMYQAVFWILKTEYGGFMEGLEGMV